MNETIFFFFYNLTHQSAFFDGLVYFLAVDFIFVVIALAFLFLFRRLWIQNQGLGLIALRSISKWREVILLCFSGGVAYVLSKILKVLIHTPRPFDVFQEVQALFIEGGYAFPSGHTMVASAVAATIFFTHKKAGYLFFAFALVVGLARITAGVHFPIDILGGFIFGVLVAYLGTKIIGVAKNRTMKHFKTVSEMPAKKYKHVFFDMDNTITPSRSGVEENMKEALIKLGEKADIIIVSGSQESQLWKQMTDYFKGKISFMAQSGNNAYSHKLGKYLWSRELIPDEKKEIFAHIDSMKLRYGDLISSVRKEEEDKLIEDRGCQISFSPVGHGAALEAKMTFDPKGETRAEMLKEVPLLSERVSVKIGGTTCFDYTQLGKNKGYNIREWLDYFSWSPEDVLYIGDALFPGGNDDTVLGVCDTLQVSGPNETLVAIRKIIG